MDALICMQNHKFEMFFSDLLKENLVSYFSYLVSLTGNLYGLEKFWAFLKYYKVSLNVIRFHFNYGCLNN